MRCQDLDVILQREVEVHRGLHCLDQLATFTIILDEMISSSSSKIDMYRM